MYSGCDYPYKSCSVCTFWSCHPYFILQFYCLYTCIIIIMYFGVYLFLIANFCHVHLTAHVLETEDWFSCSKQHGDQTSPSAVSYSNTLHWAVMINLSTDRESYLSSFICESFRWFCSLSFANCCLLICSCWLRKWHFSPTALHYYNSTNKWLILHVWFHLIPARTHSLSPIH